MDIDKSIELLRFVIYCLQGAFKIEMLLAQLEATAR
jgi:hypothetical protein